MNMNLRPPNSVPDFHPPPLDRKMLRFLQVEELHDQLRRIEALYGEVLELLTPAADWTILAMPRLVGKVQEKGCESSALVTWLKGCDRVALLAATIGERLERRARKLFVEHEIFAGYISDRMGSYLAEFWMASVDRHVEEILKIEGCRCTRRYSPGYVNTPLELQDLFLEFAQRRIPFLKLSDARMIVPEKSVFAFKGIYCVDRKFQIKETAP